MHIPSFSIRNPALLEFHEGDLRHFGADQAWYAAFWQRQAGCGPTVAAMTLWYLSCTRDECACLCTYNAQSKAGILRLMREMWAYITPSLSGVNITAFTDGITRYGAERSVFLSPTVLHIPADKKLRPGKDEIIAFLKNAFAQDFPVCFLNYSNGALTNLETWHWVTLIGVDEDLTAVMYDQGKHVCIDISLWLDTTKRDGWFVVVDTKSYAQNPYGH